MVDVLMPLNIPPIPPPPSAFPPPNCCVCVCGAANVLLLARGVGVRACCVVVELSAAAEGVTFAISPNAEDPPNADNDDPAPPALLSVDAHEKDDECGACAAAAAPGPGIEADVALGPDRLSEEAVLLELGAWVNASAGGGDTAIEANSPEVGPGCCCCSGCFN